MLEKNITKKLAQNNYKLTGQRLAVLQVMMENKGHHLSAEEVLTAARKKHSHIGIATVYRTLERLAAIEILYKIMFDTGKYRYELAGEEDQPHHHHHMICLGCGKITEVGEDLLSNLEEHLEKQNYKIVDHELKLYGYCPDCNK